jgi:hypothetical protein
MIASKDRRVRKKTQKINVLFGKERFPCNPPLWIMRILLSAGNKFRAIMSVIAKNNLPVYTKSVGIEVFL